MCRHRGVLLCDEPGSATGSVARITAGPTDWMARCRRPRIGTALPKGGPDDSIHDQLHLEVVPSAVWAGMVFVHLGAVEQSFVEATAALSNRWEALDLGRLAHVERARWIRHRRELEARRRELPRLLPPAVHPSASRIRRCRSRRGRSRSRRADHRRYVPSWGDRQGVEGRPSAADVRRCTASRCSRDRTSSVSSRTRSCSSRPTGSR